MLQHFHAVFPLPPETQFDALVDAWYQSIGRADETTLRRAAGDVMAKVKRFPFPADFHEVIDWDLVNLYQAHSPAHTAAE